jgi:23S rRNA pseudouridine1911/1915/1917 synthase
MTNFKIDNSVERNRLDKFLVEKLGKTRNQIQKLIKSGLVLVNQKAPSVHQFLKINDEITINEPQIEAKTPQTAVKSWFKKLTNKTLTPKIIAKEKDYLIISKPAGLLVHPTVKNETDTLVDWLIKKYPKLKKLGEDPARPALVHRLDREVSGLMIIPRTQDAFDYFKKQFKMRTIRKEYIALVHDVVLLDTGTIDFPVGRSTAGNYVAMPKGSEVGKVALTEYDVIERFRTCTLLKVRIYTGRTNQIRLHLNAIKHPVVGDAIQESKVQKDKFKLNRIFLHSTRLEFTAPNGALVNYECGLPEELEKVLESLSPPRLASKLIDSRRREAGKFVEK